MKKNNFILWISSFVITFLTIYISNLFSVEYPITGTIGIDGKKVSYRFEKLHYIDNYMEIIIRSDVDSLSGNIYWKHKESSEDWLIIKLRDSTNVLKGVIPNQTPLNVIEYYVRLNHKNKKYILPDNNSVDLIFFGKISPMLKVLQFLLLYVGLFLSVRTGLEYFNNNQLSKKFGVLTGIVFLTLTFLINPLYLTYKFGYMNHSIPSLTKLFPVGFLTITLIWIVSTVLLFIKKEWNYTSIVGGVLSILIIIFLM